MSLIRYIQKKTEPYPLLYKILLLAYSLYGETSFLVHALYTGKLMARLKRNPFSEIISRQKILEFSIPGQHVTTVEAFRQWLNREGIQYLEGGWTFFIPRQKGLSRYFEFLPANYPVDSGLKILKDFRHPHQAKYTVNRQNPAPGAALKRRLTPSPMAMVRVANYLYLYGLGVRIYDLLALKAGRQHLTCYVVQHLEGPDAEQKDYDDFMRRLKALLARKEITTIHERLDMMYDFEPPNCNHNLVMNGQDGRPLYVDFQGFLLKDEGLIIEKAVEAAVEKAGGVPSYGGAGKYLHQSLAGLSKEKKGPLTRGQHMQEMMEECGCSFPNRVLYQVGCNTGLIIYNALSAGAQWGVGWDTPEVVSGAKRLLLGLGATRFDLWGEVIQEKTEFLPHLPERFRNRNHVDILYFSIRDPIGLPLGLAQLPWEYMFYEGQANQTYDLCLNTIRQISWLQDATVMSHRVLAEDDTPERVVILLKR